MTTASERVLRTLLGTAVDYAIIATDLDGLVTCWSEGAHAILGWTAAQMTGRDVSVLLTPEDRCTQGAQAERTAALAHGTATVERWLSKQDGARFWASGTIMPLKDDDGQPCGLLQILRDRTARRLAEERQHADAEFLRSVLASSGDCIKVLDLDGRLLFMNEGGLNTMEVSDFNTIRGCSWPDLWQDAGNTEASRAIAAARAGRTGAFQGSADTFAGNPRHWDVQITPIRSPDGKPEKLLAVSRDISGAREAELALREAQGLNTLILESSRDCIVVLDLDGRSLFISPGGIAAMEIADVSKVLGLSWLRVWHGDDAAPARLAVAEARAGRIGRFQGFCPTHRGKPKWWDVVLSPLPGPDGRPERLVSVGRDITEARLARQRLLLSEERLQLALGASEMVGIWDADLLAGTLYGDANFARMHGIDAAEAQAGAPLVHAFRNVHPDDLVPFHAEIRRIMDGAETLDIEHRLLQPDGSVRWVVAQGRLVRDTAGLPTRLPGALVDVTERRLAAERQDLLMAELAHRVKNTLAVVQSIARQTLRGGTGTATARDAFSARLVALAGAHEVLLQGSWSKASLRSLVEAAARLHAPPNDGRQHARFLVEGGDVILGSRAALAFALVLHEMGTNAVKYGALSTSPEGSAGQVRVHWSVIANRLHFRWSEHGGPPVAAPTYRGFGSRLIERSLVTDFDANVDLAYAAAGVTLTLDANLNTLQQS